jgi:hypothetical protein
MSRPMPSSQKSGGSDHWGADYMQWYVLGIIFQLNEDSADDSSSTLIASKAQKDPLSQQTSCKPRTRSVTQAQPRTRSHHDPRLNDENSIHASTSNTNYTSQTNRGNFDEKAGMTEYYHNLASSRENALLHIGIGSQFEEVNFKNVGEVAYEEHFTPARPACCLYMASSGIQRGPMERYLSQTVEEDPWVGEDSLWG